MTLDSPVTEIPLVGPAKAEKLLNLRIESVRDFIFHIPSRYRDTSEILPVDIFKLEKEGTILVQVKSIKNSYTRSRKVITKATLVDANGEIDAVWWNQPYLTKAIKQGEWYLFEGKIPDKPKVKDISNPSYEKYTGDISDQKHIGKITPIYPETAGVSSKWLRSRLDAIKKEIPEMIQTSELDTDNLSLSEAMEMIHFPQTREDIDIARERLGFDEMLRLAVQIEQAKQDRSEHSANAISDNSYDAFMENVPFELTADQKKALDEILGDIDSTNQMYRLLNGDVGSGKTVVAAIAAYVAHKSGLSTLIMAPTTILANQHYATFIKLFEPLGIQVELRIGGGSLTSNGNRRIIIGTHALLFEPNLPKNVGLLVVDEQHRFGVKQREKLLELNEDNTIPHYLSMTATPIPRSLTTVIFGDMEVSLIKEQPSHRKPIKSYFVPHEKRQDNFKWIKDKITDSNKEEQAFIVLPHIEEGVKAEIKSVKKEYDLLSKGVFKNLSLGMLHGQMKAMEKEQVMEDFLKKKINILISTTVIEVGIDVPDATIIVIENAEIFGLAQLHQLRGRVGRGFMESFCYVIGGEDMGSESPQHERLQYFVEHSSGFDVAEYDLQSRGPGEVYGVRQSGIPNFKVASIMDMKLLVKAREKAQELLATGQAPGILDILFR